VRALSSRSLCQSTPGDRDSRLYIAASGLIPETHEEKCFENAGFLLLGVLFLYLLSKTIGV